MLGRMPAHLLSIPTAPVHHLFVPGYDLDLSWGDVPTWLAAVGTVGALIAAFIQISTERRLRHDRELKEQARLISAITGPALRDAEAQAEAEAGGPG